MYIDIFNWTIEDLIFFFYRKGIFEKTDGTGVCFCNKPYSILRTQGVIIRPYGELQLQKQATLPYAC